MKKVLSIILSLTMLCSANIAVFAEKDTQDLTEQERIETVKNSGYTDEKGMAEFGEVKNEEYNEVGRYKITLTAYTRYDNSESFVKNAFAEVKNGELFITLPEEYDYIHYTFKLNAVGSGFHLGASNEHDDPAILDGMKATITDKDDVSVTIQIGSSGHYGEAEFSHAGSLAYTDNQGGALLDGYEVDVHYMTAAVVKGGIQNAAVKLTEGGIQIELPDGVKVIQDIYVLVRDENGKNVENLKVTMTDKSGNILSSETDNGGQFMVTPALLSEMYGTNDAPQGTAAPDKPKATAVPNPVQTALPTSTPQPNLSYPDVPKTHWAYDVISEVTELGALSGYEDGTFRPENKITHEEFTKILSSMLDNGIIEPSLSDYAPYETSDKTDSRYYLKRWSAWAQPYLNSSLKLSLIQLGDEDLIQKETHISRQEMAKMISRAMEIKNTKFTTDIEKALGKVADYGVISDKYKNYIANVYSEKIITGYEDETFRPEGYLTRAEAAAVIVKLVNAVDMKEIQNYDPTDIEDKVLASRVRGLVVDIASVNHALANLDENEKKISFSSKAKYLIRAEQSEKNIFGKNTYFSDYITYDE